MYRSNATSIFCIIATEFCERFSFCGLRTILSLYLRNVLCLHEDAATVVYHIFIMTCYTMPLVGAILADNYIGRYKVILYFSIIYFLGTVCICLSAVPPLMLPPTITSIIGLVLIAIGTGGIKPCVAAFGGDQFRLPAETAGLQRFFSNFYMSANLGGCAGMLSTPALRRSVPCFGDDCCYALAFGFPALLVAVSIVTFWCGKPSYRIKQPRENVTFKFVACTWYAFKKHLSRDPSVPVDHWLDHSVDKYGRKLVADMKVVFSILYLYLPVPIFWSLFDQQGSRWTFQASRLRSEVFGFALTPDQLQVLNPALVLLLLPLCPGGGCSLLPDLPPLHKMFAGGVLAALAFVAAGILQIGIERSTQQAPGRQHTGLVFLNTLPCGVEMAVRGAGVAALEPFGTAVAGPLPLGHLGTLAVRARSPAACAGRRLRRRTVTHELNAVSGMFMPIVIGQNSDDMLSLYCLDPDPFSKSTTGKPKLKVVFIGETGPDKNVTVSVETDKRLSDIYYVSDTAQVHIGESAYIILQPGKMTWRAESAGAEVRGSGLGALRAGGVYVLALRARRGRLDAASLHAPAPPNELRLLWILPQYVLISLAEILFAVSGLEFSFMQAPKSMKTITIAAWYVSVAFGNLIVILVAQAKIFDSRATELFVYAGTLGLAMLAFLLMSRGFQSRGLDCDASSNESNPLLRQRPQHMVSVHSLATQSSTRNKTSGAGRSLASCLGLMEQARPNAWPARANIHLATPPSSDATAATRAAALDDQRSPSNPDEEPLFSAAGYPGFGDIPLLNRKVFKGSRVEVAEQPFVASIRRNSSHYLVGAILTDCLLVTVAHPLFHVPNYELGVVVGESYSDRGTSLHTVLALVLHEHFDPWTLKHDLALLRLFEQITFKHNVKPILLERGLQPLTGATAFVSGWGRCDRRPSDLCLPRSSTYYPGEIQDPMLRAVAFSFSIHNPHCNKYKEQGTPLSDGMMCAGTARAGVVTAPCLAVPGAPLTLRGRLLGLQSWGFGCGHAGDLPLVYTDLRRYHRWLVTNLQVMANITQSDLGSLFKATKSFMLREVMYETRKYRPPEHSHDELMMEPLPLDEKLAALTGKVYDLRDFLGQKFHHQKKEMYRTLKLKILDQQRQSEPLSNTASENVSRRPSIGVTHRPSTGAGVTNDADSDYYQELAPSLVN